MSQAEVSDGLSRQDAGGKPVRVRFAPSPTGIQHIGGYRTCIFIWLFARRYGGKYLLRIEDTDTGRSVPEAVDALLDGLRWLDILPDEGPLVGGPYGPYYQTQRQALYEIFANELIARGGAYRCYCTEERLAQIARPGDEIERDREWREYDAGRKTPALEGESAGGGCLR